jgi:hypothetical protein
MRCAGNVAAWERREMHWLENPKGRDHFEVLGIDSKIILKWTSGKKVRGCGLDSSDSG